MLKQYQELLNLDATIAKELFESVNHPWEVLPNIKDFILKAIPSLSEEYEEISENVYAHKSAKISPSACINGPAIIGQNTEIRHCAFIRGSAVIGDNCVIGNSTEVKNAIIFNNVQCPHYNYVGDAVLGEYAHTGAGVILSNVKSDKTNIKVKEKDEVIETGLRKFSAIIGDHVEVGCNSVICPGTIIYPNTNIYPLTRVRGVICANKIVKDMNNIIEKESK
ncbi:MAG: UDP-N-acetylglucosamine pyrophosphorylase [Firmicutes bacterium]|nr:UDP-N-acetylglucosamine pyrophosphorylase [Bacillota bacterium]